MPTTTSSTLLESFSRASGAKSKVVAIVILGCSPANRALRCALVSERVKIVQPRKPKGGTYNADIPEVPQKNGSTNCIGTQGNT